MSETAQGHRHVTTIFRETLGRDLLALIIGELRTQPNHWMRMDQEEQGKALERIKDRVRSAVIDCSSILMSTNFPMVKAELESVTIKDGVRISLAMAPADPNRHQLYDAKGKQCLLVLGDAETWLERMEEVKAMSDQQDWIERDYDPTKDQPGYRRDQSATKPTGMSWGELRAKLSEGLMTKSEAEEAYGAPLPEIDPNPDPLDIKGKDRTGPPMGIIQYRALQTDEPDSWGDWVTIPNAQLPDIDDDETLREALAAIHSPITTEFRFIPDGAARPADDSVIVDQENEVLDLAAQAADLRERLYAIGMIVPLAVVKGLSPEQSHHARLWLSEYHAWAEKPDRKKKAMPKRPHFLPLFDPLPHGTQPPSPPPPPEGESL